MKKGPPRMALTEAAFPRAKLLLPSTGGEGAGRVWQGCRKQVCFRQRAEIASSDHGPIGTPGGTFPGTDQPAPLQQARYLNIACSHSGPARPSRLPHRRSKGAAASLAGTRPEAAPFGAASRFSGPGPWKIPALSVYYAPYFSRAPSASQQPTPWKDSNE